MSGLNVHSLDKVTFFSLLVDTCRFSAENPDLSISFYTAVVFLADDDRLPCRRLVKLFADADILGLKVHFFSSPGGNRLVRML